MAVTTTKRSIRLALAFRDLSHASTGFPPVLAAYMSTYINKSVRLPDSTRESFEKDANRWIRAAKEQEIPVVESDTAVMVAGKRLRTLLDRDASTGDADAIATLKTLDAFRRGEITGVSITNMPKDEAPTPPTPHRLGRIVDAPIGFFASFAIMHLSGMQLWKPPSADESLMLSAIFNVVADPSFRASCEAQKPHVDHELYAGYGSIPDVTSLTCISNAEGTQTYFIPAEKIWESLSEKSKEELSKAQYAFFYKGTMFGEPFAIFSPDGKTIAAEHAADDLLCRTESGRAALYELYDIIEASLHPSRPESKADIPAVDVEYHTLEGGEMVVWDNLKTLHGRPAVERNTTLPSTQKRWLLRLEAERAAAEAEKVMGGRR